MRYIYGPVPSWRLGKSLGVDLISGEKICTFDCCYCQLGKTVRNLIKRSVYIPTSEIVKELESLPDVELDYITLSGTGEPTLASNLGEVISEIKKRFKKPVAVLTNSFLMHEKKVREELALADKVVAKLDAPSEQLFREINKPSPGVSLEMIVSSLKKFNQEHHGKLALQMMFMPQNKDVAKEMVALAKEINPIEVQVNTPLRPCPVRPLIQPELAKIRDMFKPLKAFSVYEVEKVNANPMDEAEIRKRRPAGVC
ncbi:radical SAM protein [Candidatus Saganbacteria bacterium CG08_land_8_20_14_0_20_45_16]|uniref:Radical SAM protein n=1 Tax=Candidatus Saganbacteria bacterium CG08_land_8_20_14_0_20_45_16 TaxID=2014293 RepID=A0A2H0XV05_UNCSA|nr:MAG: radical SAM protein [Candidatus Saganbacteria bacterium CG08_land_8_20_14_0_20_45_16]